MSWWNTKVVPFVRSLQESPQAEWAGKQLAAVDTYVLQHKDTYETVNAALLVAAAPPLGLMALLGGCSPKADTGSECDPSLMRSSNNIREVENIGDRPIRVCIGDPWENTHELLDACNDIANESAGASCTTADESDDFESCDDASAGNAAFDACIARLAVYADSLEEAQLCFTLGAGERRALDVSTNRFHYTLAVGAKYWASVPPASHDARVDAMSYCPIDENNSKATTECFDANDLVLSCGIDRH